jgi:glycosyltransferase involved in cell wall biosynthesis
MRTYDKRIGFLINSDHIKPTGGNGQFAKSFCELMSKPEHRIKVDIITDSKPFYKDYANTFNKIIIPNESLSYNEHRDTFGKPDSICMERVVNFRRAIITAMATNMYDIFVCNSPESILATLHMGMEENIQIIAYTHLESQIFTDTKNPFLLVANEIMRQNLTTSGIYIATQSAFNKESLDNSYLKGKKVFECPIPLTEQALLKEYDKEREGVLFVGRWEAGKNPELFVKLIAETNYTAKIMTSSNGVKKFEKAFAEAGVPKSQYVIKAGIIGQEKVDFMTSCRVAFNPSIVESYGMAFYEQQIQMPTVCLEGQRWTNNFDENRFYPCNKNDMVDIVVGRYTEYATAKEWYETKIVDKFIEEENQVFAKWKKCFDDFLPKTVKTETAGIVSHTSVVYKTFIDNLNRKSLNLSNDIRSIYNNKGKFKVIYTDNHTHLTKNSDYVVIDPLVEETKVEKLIDIVVPIKEKKIKEEPSNTFDTLFE